MLSTILLSLKKNQAKNWIKFFDKNSTTNTYMFDDDGEDIIIHVQGDMDISNNNISKIPYKIGSVDGSFYANNCNLLTLQNSPTEVSGNYNVSFNHFKSLMGSPEYVGQNFDVQYCNNLSSFLYSPEIVIGKYLSSGNQKLKLINKIQTKMGRFSHIVTEKKQTLLGLEKEYFNTRTHLVFQCVGSIFKNYVDIAVKNNPNILDIDEGSFETNERFN